MKQYIEKSALVAEIEKEFNTTKKYSTEYVNGKKYAFKKILSFLDTLEVKEGLTWEDIRELYIIFAEVDTEIELCKVDIKSETIGYYQEVLKRFKVQKGE